MKLQNIYIFFDMKWPKINTIQCIYSLMAFVFVLTSHSLMRTYILTIYLRYRRHKPENKITTGFMTMSGTEYINSVFSFLLTKIYLIFILPNTIIFYIYCLNNIFYIYLNQINISIYSSSQFFFSISRQPVLSYTREKALRYSKTENSVYLSARKVVGLRSSIRDFERLTYKILTFGTRFVVQTSEFSLELRVFTPHFKLL